MPHTSHTSCLISLTLYAAHLTPLTLYDAHLSHFMLHTSDVLSCTLMNKQAKSLQVPAAPAAPAAAAAAPVGWQEGCIQWHADTLKCTQPAR
jgi:hypothetical protein